MRHVFYRPIYGTVPDAYNGKMSVCFFSNEPRAVSGSQLKQIVKSSE